MKWLALLGIIIPTAIIFYCFFKIYEYISRPQKEDEFKYRINGFICTKEEAIDISNELKLKSIKYTLMRWNGKQWEKIVKIQ